MIAVPVDAMLVDLFILFFVIFFYYYIYLTFVMAFAGMAT
jgi:hypothetical protein